MTKMLKDMMKKLKKGLGMNAKPVRAHKKRKAKRA